LGYRKDVRVVSVVRIDVSSVTDVEGVRGHILIFRADFYLHLSVTRQAHIPRNCIISVRAEYTYMWFRDVLCQYGRLAHRLTHQ
jgi:hypothetical protein